MSIFQQRLAGLRAQMEKCALDGFIVPRADEFQGEYVPACAERLKWLTGFTGSAGAAVVLKDRAVVMTDGRYTIQIKRQVDRELYDTADYMKTPLTGWITENAGKGAKIGFDPWVHTAGQIDGWHEKLDPKGIEMVPVEENLVDLAWDGRPEPPMDPVEIFPEKIAGKSSADKRAEIAAAIGDQGADAAILASPDSTAWLLNIRGHDVPHVPLALSYAFLWQDGKVDWFIPESKVGADVRRHIGNAVRVRSPDDLPEAMNGLAGKTVMLDPKSAAQWFRARLEEAGAKVKDVRDPCILPKACKTKAEQEAMIRAHERDGLSLTRFLAWLDRAAAEGGQTELTIEDKLKEFRSMDPEFREDSFDPICGFGPNGAVIHYRATEETCLPIRGDSLLLIDSGGQYQEGTTDVTRTIAIGAPAQDMRENFTRVLKGHIAIASARFPEGTVGAQIDALARRPLWDAGLDYAHGTGHGVGCYLSVHEEAASISPRGTEPLRPGMVLSNEPGYYREGAYGIRIENLVLVEDSGEKNENGAAILQFRTITLAPIDRRLIEPSLLTDQEKDWLNAYHALVYSTFSEKMNDDEAKWLRQMTESI